MEVRNFLAEICFMLLSFSYLLFLLAFVMPSSFYVLQRENENEPKKKGITSGDMGGPALQNATRGDLPAIMNGDYGKAFVSYMFSIPSNPTISLSSRERET